MTRRELAEIALRYDTVMSRAMLDALGVMPRPRPAYMRRGGHGALPGVYDGLMWCFENHGSPMDMMR